MDKQYKVDGDEDATLIDIPISFIALKKANTDIVQVRFAKVPPIVSCLFFSFNTCMIIF